VAERDKAEKGRPCLLNQGINIHSVCKPTIAMVPGNCPTGLRLNAPMFDLTIAFDDAKFEDPVVSMNPAGAEILFHSYKMRNVKFTQ